MSSEALVRERVSPKRLQGLCLLVADDREESRLLLTTMLRTAGAEVDAAENGAQALGMALAGRYDVVLLDLEMPVLDGTATARVLRDGGFRGKLAALTAHAGERRARALAAGFDEFLEKTQRRDALVARIAELARREAP